MKEINDEVKAVSDMILGIVPDNNDKPFLYQIVHNKKYDIYVNKMDYFR